MPLASAQSMDFEQLSSFFHLPINDASKELGICTTLLKKICRRNGITRWPYRKIRSLDKRISTLEIAIAKNPEAEQQLTKEISALHDKRRILMKKPQNPSKSQKQKVKLSSDSQYDISSPLSASSSGSDFSSSPSNSPSAFTYSLKEEPINQINNTYCNTNTSRCVVPSQILPSQMIVPEYYSSAAFMEPIELNFLQESNFVNLISNEDWNNTWSVDMNHNSSVNSYFKEEPKDRISMPNIFLSSEGESFLY